MTYEEFAETAHRMWNRIPSRYREGVDGIVVNRRSEVHPDHDDYFTLGMCFTEPYPSGYEGPDSTRSILALFYGSFASLADSDPGFAWEDELWETITHELRHHLEHLADDDALERVDYAEEQAYRRIAGLDFDPWYYQSGLPSGPGAYRLERDMFIEQRWTQADFSAAERVEFEWDGGRWSIPRPDQLGDLHYVRVLGLDYEEGEVELVLVRELSTWDRAKKLLSGERLVLIESEAVVRLRGEAGRPEPTD